METPDTPDNLQYLSLSPVWLCCVPHLNILGSIAPTCLRAAFMYQNAVELNIYFIKIFMLNFIHYFEVKVCPTFTIRHKQKNSSVSLLLVQKAAYTMMVKLIPEVRPHLLIFIGNVHLPIYSFICSSFYLLILFYTLSFLL